jgi:hypothetical protein
MSTPEPPLEPEAFDLLALLLSSSRGAIEEGVFTASLRLVHAAERLAAIAARLPCDGERRAFYERTAAELRAGSTGSYLKGPDAYLAFLDDAVRSVAGEIRRDNGLSEPE